MMWDVGLCVIDMELMCGNGIKFFATLMQCLISARAAPPSQSPQQQLEAGQQPNGIIPITDLAQKWRRVFDEHRVPSSLLTSQSLVGLLQHLGIGTILAEAAGSSSAARMMVPYLLRDQPPAAFLEAKRYLVGSQFQDPPDDDDDEGDTPSTTIDSSLPETKIWRRKMTFSEGSILDASMSSFIVRMWRYACCLINDSVKAIVPLPLPPIDQVQQQLQQEQQQHLDQQGQPLDDGTLSVWKGGMLLRAPYDSRVMVLVERRGLIVNVIGVGSGGAAFVSSVCKALEFEYTNLFRCNDPTQSRTNTSISKMIKCENDVHEMTTFTRSMKLVHTLFRDQVCATNRKREYKLPTVWDVDLILKALIASRITRVSASIEQAMAQYLGPYTRYPVHCFVDDQEIATLRALRSPSLRTFTAIKRLGGAGGEGVVYLVRWQMANRPRRHFAMKVYYNYGMSNEVFDRETSNEYHTIERLLAPPDTRTSNVDVDGDDAPDGDDGDDAPDARHRGLESIGDSRRFISRAVLRFVTRLEKRLLPEWEVDAEMMPNGSRTAVMVMDLFDCDLESFCERATFLTYERATQLSLQFIKAVRYLGDKLVAHRDIKPNNVFVSESTLHLALGDYGMSSSLILSFSHSLSLSLRGIVGRRL